LTQSYPPCINHFIQPDTIIPDLSNPQSWNRYSYVVNNPTNHVDPTGNQFVAFVEVSIIALVGITLLSEATIYYVRETPQGQRLKKQADAAISGASDQVSQFISTNVTNRWRQFEQKVANTNSGKIFPRLPLLLLVSLGIYTVHQLFRLTIIGLQNLLKIRLFGMSFVRQSALT